MVKKRVRRIITNLVATLMVVTQITIPVCGEEIILDDGAATGGLITAGVASVLVDDEALSVTESDELLTTEEISIKDDNDTIILNGDEPIVNEPIKEIKNEDNENIAITGEQLRLDDNLLRDVTDDAMSVYLNENNDDMTDEIYIDNLYLASGNTNILVWPVPGTSRANIVRGLTYDSKGNFDHKGLDIGKSINGKTVVAAIEGEVVSKYTCTHNIYGSSSGCSKCNGNGTGLCIKGSDGRYYEYAHMQADSIPQDIEKGTHVSKGQKIGLVGNTGNSSGPHLHFQIATQGEWKGIVDPEKETYDIDGPPDDDEYGKDMGDESPYNPEIEDGKYVIMSALRDDLHLNIEGDDTADNDFNVNVERGFDEDSYYDVFKVSLLENGYYKLIQNGTNHMAVSVAGRSTSEDANIQMYYWNPEDLSNTEFQWAIKWAKKQDGKPYHYLRARCSGMYMTTAGSSNGRNVYQASKDNDDDYQKWFFARYMKPSIETDSLPNGSVGQSYSATLEADSDLDVAWTFTGKDDSLPPGLSLERSGKITGTPTTPGTYTFSLDAENALVDALGLSTRKYTIVIEGDIPVTGVTLDKSSLELNEGASATLTATVSPDNATDKSVTWKSSDEKIATVSSSGKVTAVKEGTATITVTSNSNKDKGASCKVTVKKNNNPVTSVTLDKTSLEINAGSTSVLTATVKPDNATDKTVTWKSSDEKIATVNSSGKVTAVKEGTATITVTSNSNKDKSASCKVTVKSKPTGIVIKADDVSGAAGSTVSVPVRITGNPGLGGLSLTITSDPALSIESVEKGSILSSGTFEQNKDTGLAQWYTRESAATGDGILFVVKFSVKNGAEKKNYPVNIAFKDGKKENVVDINGNTLNVSLVAGSVSTNRILGDITGDGIIAIGDVVRLARAVAGNIILTDDERAVADINGDKVIAIGDVVRLARYVEGSITEL